MIRFLLDTNIISEPVRLQPNPGVINKSKEHEFEIAMASVTWHELLFGFYRLPASKKRQRFFVRIRMLRIRGFTGFCMNIYMGIFQILKMSFLLYPENP